MSVLASSSYANAGAVANRLRAILNDSEIPGGDVLTDTAPFTFEILNGAYERVQIELATHGVETYQTEWWLLNLPIMPLTDPAARLIVDDTGTSVFYPNGIGNSFSQTPQLPVDLIVPTEVWERQSNTTQFPGKMRQNNGGLYSICQQLYLVDWQWIADGLRFRGALQAIDIMIKGEKQLPQLVVATDPVPIRGVTNAAAYYGAKIFTESRGGAVSPMHKTTAEEEVFLLAQVSARRRQHKQVRRKPYSGRGGRGTTGPII